MACGVCEGAIKLDPLPVFHSIVMRSLTVASFQFCSAIFPDSVAQFQLRERCRALNYKGVSNHPCAF